MGSGDGLTHYELLGVPKTATRCEVRKAYRQKALRHHPDKDSSETATALFQRILEAYEVLSSTQQRFLYDAGVRHTSTNKARDETARQMAAEYREERRTQLQERLVEVCKAGDTFQAMKLLRGCSPSDINSLDATGRTALMHAAEGLHVQVVSLLALYQADVNAVSSDGWSAIMFTLSSLQENEAQTVACLESLLGSRADANVKTHSGLTPLLFACASSSLPSVQALLAAGADVGLADERGVMPLMMSAEGGNADVVRSLLQAQAFVNATDDGGRTPVMAASSLAHVEVVTILLEAGADVNAIASDGSTSLLHAVEYFVQECLPHQGPGDSSKESSAFATIAALLAAGSSVDTPAEDGRTPLQLAERAGDGASSIFAMLVGSEAERCPKAYEDSCKAVSA